MLACESKLVSRSSTVAKTVPCQTLRPMRVAPGVAIQMYSCFSWNCAHADFAEL